MNNFDREWAKIEPNIEKLCRDLAQSMGVDGDDIIQNARIKVWQTWKGGAMLTYARRAALWAAVSMRRAKHGKRPPHRSECQIHAEWLLGEHAPVESGAAGGNEKSIPVHPALTVNPWDEIDSGLSHDLIAQGQSEIDASLYNSVRNGLSVADASKEVGLVRGDGWRRLRRIGKRLQAAGAA